MIFAAVKNGEQPKCPMTSDWINKRGPVQMMADNETQRGRQRGEKCKNTLDDLQSYV